MISTLIEVPGASNVIEQGYVVYSNKAKMNILNVNSNSIVSFGVVSKEVAIEMSRNLKKICSADIAVSTTGEAGPSLGSEGVKVGTVCIAFIIGKREYSYEKHFEGNRVEVIESTVSFVIDELYNLII